VEWKIQITFLFNITNNMTTYIDLDNLKLKATGVSDYPGKKPSLATWNSIISGVAARVVKGKVNKPFENGPAPIGGILKEQGLGILDI